jgi:hypothetical protein
MPPPVDYSITQHFPVADHVYKYLITRCGSDHITASRHTSFGSLALSLHGRNPDVKPGKLIFTKVFKVTVQEEHFKRLGMHITSENAQLFNDQVDKMFREELFYHIMINKGIDAAKYLDSIRTFLMVYNITEDDIKLDTLYRDFKRRKDAIDLNLKLIPAHG